VLVLILAARLIWVVSPAGGGRPIRVDPLVLDPNLASVEELQLLPGVGRSRAEQIVLERIRRGPGEAEGLGMEDGIFHDVKISNAERGS